MGTVIPGRWGSGRSETSARSKARGTRGGTGPPYQLKISLLEIEPEVWRWLLVPGGVRLERLHEIFQLTMGWTNSHLHEFRVGDTRYGEPDPEYDEGDVRDERSVRLFEVAPRVNVGPEASRRARECLPFYSGVSRPVQLPKLGVDNLRLRWTRTALLAMTDCEPGLW